MWKRQLTSWIIKHKASIVKTERWHVVYIAVEVRKIFTVEMMYNYQNDWIFAENNKYISLEL